MLVNRRIGDIDLKIETSAGNLIYFTPKVAEDIQKRGISFTYLTKYLYDMDQTFRPYSVLWELLKECNYSCPFCYINSTPTGPKSFTWRWDDVKEDVDDLIDSGMITCTLSGGEPLLHPDFAVVYRYLKERGVIVRIFSNLSLLTKEIEELLSELPPFKLEVSLYGANQETYCATTRQSRIPLESIQRNILRLRSKGINVICKTVLNSLTYPSWHAMEDWCSQNGVPYFFSMDMQNKYNGEDISEFLLTKKEKFEVFSKLYTSLKTREKAIACKEMFSCDAGKTGCMIAYDFTVRPCMSFFDVPECCFKAEFGKLKAAILNMVEKVDKLRGQKLSFCKGCEAIGACKLCAVNELKSRLNPAEKPHHQCLETRCMFEKMCNG